MVFLICLLFLCLGCISCDKKPKGNTIKIAEQYGLAYAPLQIMKEMGFLEKQSENFKVEWVQLSNTASIREAVLSEDVSVGFMGIPPFLIGVDNGMNWKIFGALSESPVGLVTNREEIITLSDFSEKDKIVLPQPGSIQHILLAMTCEKQFGTADIFDNRLISMSHPDGFQALQNGKEVSAHYTSPPYLFEELKNPNNHLVVSGKDAVGEDFSFIVGVCTEDFYQNEELYKAVKNAINISIDYMKSNPRETLEILSKAYDLEKEQLEEYLNYEGMVYTTQVKGTDIFVDFMYRNGYLNKQYTTDELIWD